MYHQDEWYELNIGESYQDVFDQLKSDVDNHLFSFFEELNTLKSLIDVVRTPKNELRYPLDRDSDYEYLSEFECGDL
ncbi:hypothetical protein GCM10028827_17920 [Mucilaginibacter myungsuensis]